MDISSTPKSTMLSAGSQGPADNIMEDIQDLLQLESMRRDSDDFKNIQRQVEDHSRLWVDAKLEYLALYNHLIELMKKVGIRHSLDLELQTVLKDTIDTAASVSTMRSILSSNMRPVQVNEMILQETTEHLMDKHRPRHNLDKQQRVYAKNHETQKGIAEMMDNIKKLMETLIQQAMNQSVVEVSQAIVTAEKKDNS